MRRISSPCSTVPGPALRSGSRRGGPAGRRSRRTGEKLRSSTSAPPSGSGAGIGRAQRLARAIGQRHPLSVAAARAAEPGLHHAGLAGDAHRLGDRQPAPIRQHGERFQPAIAARLLQPRRRRDIGAGPVDPRVGADAVPTFEPHQPGAVRQPRQRLGIAAIAARQGLAGTVAERAATQAGEADQPPVAQLKPRRHPARHVADGGDLQVLVQMQRGKAAEAERRVVDLAARPAIPAGCRVATGEIASGPGRCRPGGAAGDAGRGGERRRAGREQRPAAPGPADGAGHAFVRRRARRVPWRRAARPRRHPRRTARRASSSWCRQAPRHPRWSRRGGSSG